MENALASMQELVGGYIEAVYLRGGMVIICNEEGKLRGLEPNFPLGLDVICGPAVFLGLKGGEFADLPMAFKDFKAAWPHLWEA